MPRFVGISVAVLAALLIVGQLALPPFLANRVEDRLTEGGGQADVELSAFPAIRLLWADGDEFVARGRGLDLDIDQRQELLHRLDGFSEVDIALQDMRAGPLQLSRFGLVRREGEPDYGTDIQGRMTPRDVAAFLGSQAGGPLGGLFGDFAAGALPGGGDTEVPLELGARIISREGRAEAISADGEVGGVPAGPLAELIVDAVLAQL